jgi:hypothetical protein
MYRYGKQKYSTDVEVLIRTTDGATIPRDDSNVDYQMALRWVAEGGVIADAQTPQEALDETIFRNNETIKAALLENDIKAIRALIDDDKVRIAVIKKEQSDRRKLLVPPGE